MILIAGDRDGEDGDRGREEPEGLHPERVPHDEGAGAGAAEHEDSAGQAGRAEGRHGHDQGELDGGGPCRL